MKKILSFRNTLVRYVVLTFAILMFVSVAQTRVFAISTKQASLISPSGTIYYVSMDGDNDNPGTENQPWQTLEYAVSQLQAGDTLLVKAGIYTPGPNQNRIKISNSGTDTEPITITGYGNDRPIIIPTGGEDTGPGEWIGLVDIRGSNIHFERFEISHSTGRGIVVLSNQNVTISDVWVHHTVNAGIFMEYSDNFVLENSRVWMTNRINDPDGPWYKPNMWSGGVHPRKAKNITIRGNEIFHSYGEGINIHGEADGVMIEDNVLYDCFGPIIFPTNSVNILIQRNLVYHTNDPEFQRNGNPGAGIILSDEARPGLLDNITVINNLVIGTRDNFGFWTGFKPESGLKNSLIAHNTFVNAKTNSSSWAGNIKIPSGQHMNTIFENNIIIQTDPSVSITKLEDVSGITFSNNLWYPAANVPDKVKSPGDLYVDPHLSFNGSISPGELDADYFKLLSSSPAIDHALSSPVSNDFFLQERDSSPDIGGNEYKKHSPNVFSLFWQKLVQPMFVELGKIIKMILNWIKVSNFIQ